MDFNMQKKTTFNIVHLRHTKLFWLNVRRMLHEIDASFKWLIQVIKIECRSEQRNRYFGSNSLTRGNAGEKFGKFQELEVSKKRSINTQNC